MLEGRKIVVKYKICGKCKTKKPIAKFHKNKSKKSGFDSWCKCCRNQYDRERYKQRTESDIGQVTKQRRKYKQEHAEQISEQRKQYRNNNKKLIKKDKKQYWASIAVFETHFEKLKIFEEVRRCSENLELLETKCTYCGRWLKPTNMQVRNRLQAFNGTMSGECRFYCSENCKQSCPTYRQQNYTRGFKKATSREVVPLLRQLVLKRDNYECQMCFATIKTTQLHVHHEKSYTLNKIMANDPDNCWTLCKECHKKVHKQDGCRYKDLKC